MYCGSFLSVGEVITLLPGFYRHCRTGQLKTLNHRRPKNIQSIKALAGSDPASLDRIQHHTDRAAMSDLTLALG